MRIAQIGNLNNHGYKYAKFLREKGIESDLFLYSNRMKLNLEHPQWEDPECAERLPEWVKIWDPSPSLYSLGPKIEKYRELRKYDLIHARGFEPAYVQFLFKPYVVHSLGDDMRLKVCQDSFEGRLLARAYRKSNLILFCNLDTFSIVDEKKLTQARYFPNPFVTDKYKPGKSDLDFGNNGLTVFHPTNLDWSDWSNRKHERNSFKGNELLIKGFAKWIKTGRQGKLILLERGPDVEVTKQLIQDLGIGSQTVFYKELNKAELVNFYNGVDVIADQFVLPSFGSISLEAMSCGRVVLKYMEDKLNRRYYDDPVPILNAKTEEDIFQCLERANDRSFREKLGREAREFVLKYHNWERVTEVLINYYKDILNVN